MPRKFGLAILAIGAIMAVFAPRHATSLTIQSYDEAATTNPSAVLSTPDPSVVFREIKSSELTERANKLKGKWGGQCVTFARNFTSATPDVVGGVARNVKTSTTTPEVGYIVKTKESSAGHLAVIIDINDDSITVVESNYHFNGIIGTREIPIDSPLIVGYIIIN